MRGGWFPFRPFVPYYVNMWNSPDRPTPDGKQFSVAELTGLAPGADLLMRRLTTNTSRSRRLHERFLERFSSSQLIFAMARIFDQMLSPTPVRHGGHYGYEEALVAEILTSTNHAVATEFRQPPGTGGRSRKMVWNSIQRLNIQVDDPEDALPALDGLGVDFKSPTAYEDRRITPRIWTELILSDDSLFRCFLWDDDWRLFPPVMLQDPRAATFFREADINSDAISATPKIPNTSELESAKIAVGLFIIECDKAVLNPN